MKGRIGSAHETATMRAVTYVGVRRRKEPFALYEPIISGVLKRSAREARLAICSKPAGEGS